MANEKLLLSHLPEELIDHIFSFLPLSDRKSASLVCQLWSDLAFNTKFLRKITLTLNIEEDQPLLQYLRKSSRKYRNVYITFSYLMQNYGMINDILDLFGSNLESFCCLSDLSEEELWNVLIRSPNLERLIAEVHFRNPNRPHLCYPEMNRMSDLYSLMNVLQIPNLNTSNISKLSVNFFDPEDASRSISVIRRLAPQLKSLEWISTDYFVPIDDLQFPKMEILKLGGHVCSASDNTMTTFFAGFKYLTEVDLNFDVCEAVLEVLAKMCPGIQKLKLNYDKLNSNSFNLLLPLKHLKMLSLYGRNDFSIVNNGKPLVSVQQLHLKLYSRHSDSSAIEGFRKLFPNVIDMGVTLLANAKPECIMVPICKNFRGLKRLTVSFAANNSFLNDFHFLHRLEELILEESEAPMVCMSPSRLLKRLKFIRNQWLTDEELLKLPELYPNLRYLELAHCKEVTFDGAEQIRSRLTNCVVQYF